MRFLLYSLVIICLFSCKTHNLLMEPRAEREEAVLTLDSSFYYAPDYQYHIRKDDKISISVWGQDELSVGSSYGIYNSNEVYGKWLMVDFNGNIEIPKLGTTEVDGLTTIELKEQLKASFAKWVINPVVDIKILNKEITVLGEVRNPQVIPVDKDHYPLLQLIAVSGGFEFYANIRYIKVLRQQGTDVVVANIDLSESGNYLEKNIQILPGDIIIVPSKKNKEFDKRVSTIIPFTTAATTAAILLGTF